MHRRLLLPATISLLLASAVGAQRSERTYRQEYQAGLDALRAQRWNEGIASFERCLSLQPGSASSAYNLACAYAQQGDVERGLDWLGRAIDKGWADPDHLRWDSDLTPLRTDPRFDQLLVVVDERYPAELRRQASERVASALALRQHDAQIERIAQASKIVWQDGHAGAQILGIRVLVQRLSGVVHGAFHLLQDARAR